MCVELQKIAHFNLKKNSFFFFLFIYFYLRYKKNNNFKFIFHLFFSKFTSVLHFKISKLIINTYEILIRISITRFAAIKVVKLLTIRAIFIIISAIFVMLPIVSLIISIITSRLE